MATRIAVVGENKVSFLFNDGNGAFPLERSHHLGPEEGPLVLADVESDGDLDLAVAAFGVPVQITATGPAILQVFLNHGDGSFTDSQDVARVGSRPVSIGAADLDGDNYPEILVPSSSARDLSILWTHGRDVTRPVSRVETAAATSTLLSADLDLDGNLDLVGANAIPGGFLAFFGIGTKAIENPTPFLVGDELAGLAAGDFDGDGDLDLTALGQDELSVFVNLGARSFSPPQLTSLESFSPAVTLVSGDFNRDGRVDLAAVARSEVRWLLNDGGGGFAEGDEALFDVPAVSAAAQDMDGDGHLDLLTLHSQSDPGTEDFVSVFLNERDGTFAPARSFRAAQLATHFAAGDLDGDGAIDVAVTNFQSGTISVLTNEGEARLSAPALHSVGREPIFVEAVDLDGDRDLDLGIRRSFGENGSINANASDGFTLIRNLGGGVLSAPKNFSFGWGPGSHTAADFDGDGDLDLAATETVEYYRHGIILVENRAESFSMDLNQNDIPDQCDEPARFQRGDADQDGTRNITDAIYVLTHLFQGGEAPGCESSADANDDGVLDLSDPIAILRFLFLSADPLPEPFLQCGRDPTRDSLACPSFQPCG